MPTDDTDPTPDPKPDPAPKPDTDPAAAEVEKWKAMARKHEQQAKANADAATKLAQIEDASKSETERLSTALAAAEANGAQLTGELLKLDVALDRAPEGMSVAQVRKLAKRLTGSSREDLEADAEELFADFGGEHSSTPPPGGRPRERLRGGGDPTDEPEDTDPRALAAKVPRF